VCATGTLGNAGGAIMIGIRHLRSGDQHRETLPFRRMPVTPIPQRSKKADAYTRSGVQRSVPLAGFLAGSGWLNQRG
jgi:hypothetical protein